MVRARGRWRCPRADGGAVEIKSPRTLTQNLPWNETDRKLLWRRQFLNPFAFEGLEKTVGLGGTCGFGSLEDGVGNDCNPIFSLKAKETESLRGRL